VLIPTYNHEPFIAQAVNSALAQRTNFPIEIVIGEDCSTDGTREIVRRLAQAHPQTIRLHLREKNLGGSRNFSALFSACRGVYVSILEGDDYWTNPQKIQKQVEALDAHPEWAICFHPARMVFEDGSRPPSVYPANWTKDVATIDDLFRENFIFTCSVVFRNRLFGPMPPWHSQIVPGDWALHILNSDHGQIGCLWEVMADYRVHSAGMWSSKSKADQHAEVLRMFSRVDHHFGGKYARQIDEYRINLVTELTRQVEALNEQVASREQVAQEAQPAVAVVHWKRRPAPSRSAAYKLGRAVLRPLERFGRRVGESIGIRTRAG
jgi:glycosyltransferase involved in cell wall biosynthesis